MEIKTEIIKSIHLGMRRGYYTNLEMKNSWVGFDKTMIEYLLTVFVAIELKDFQAFETNKEIKLEYPLFEFYNKAFPENKWTNENDLFKEKKLITRDFNEDPTKKRIDIAVMYHEPSIYGHYRSLHGIEIKAINGSNTTIIEDLHRLSKSMINKSSIDESSIQSCYSAFILSYSKSKETSTEKDLDSLKNSKLAIINEILKSKRIEYSDLKFKLTQESIERDSYESYLEKNKGIPDFDISWDPINETGEVLSVVIEITRKK